RAAASTPHAGYDGVDFELSELARDRGHDLALFAAVRIADLLVAHPADVRVPRLETFFDKATSFVAAKDVVPHLRNRFSFQRIEALCERLQLHLPRTA